MTRESLTGTAAMTSSRKTSVSFCSVLRSWRINVRTELRGIPFFECNVKENVRMDLRWREVYAQIRGL